jgi:hypothetical protein
MATHPWNVPKDINRNMGHPSRYQCVDNRSVPPPFLPTIISCEGTPRFRGTRLRSWLRHWATCRQVTRLIPDGPQYGPGVHSASYRNEYQGCLLQGKNGRWLGLTTLPPSCADCREIWELQPRGTLRASPGLYGNWFTFFTPRSNDKTPQPCFLSEEWNPLRQKAQRILLAGVYSICLGPFLSQGATCTLGPAVVVFMPLSGTQCLETVLSRLHTSFVLFSNKVFRLLGDERNRFQKRFR